MIGDGVITPVSVRLAADALLLDVRNLAACRELSIPTDHAPAGECSKPQEPNETHCLEPPILPKSKRRTAESHEP
jgi:hypothetical protein